MPRKGLASLEVLLVIVAVIGATITVRALVHIFQFEQYKPVFEDWLWNVILPTLVYCGFLVTAASIWSRPAQTLYGVALLSLLLLLIGIHNAWDIAVWLSFFKGDDEKPDDKS